MSTTQLKDSQESNANSDKQTPDNHIGVRELKNQLTRVVNTVRQKKRRGRTRKNARRVSMSVVDASVYIAINKDDEPGHEASIQWMLNMRASGEKVYAPYIFLAEVCAAISRITGDPVEAEAILKRLINSAVITLIPITESLAVRAAEIGIDQKIRGCDAIYVAVAEQLGETLVTLDKQQHDRGAAVVPTIMP